MRRALAVERLPRSVGAVQTFAAEYEARSSTALGMFSAASQESATPPFPALEMPFVPLLTSRRFLV